MLSLNLKKKKQKKKTNVHDKVSELYNSLIETNFDKYYDLSDAKRSKIGPKYDPGNLTLDNGIMKNHVIKKN